MERMSKLNNESGQAVVEYILMVLIGLGAVIILSSGLRQIVLNTWQELSCDIVAPCPECQAPATIRNQIAPTCRR
jgi:Flp pilus assembly pilin Flp